MTAQQVKRGDSTGRKLPLSPRVSVFIVCLVLSGAFWLLHALSKEYTIRIGVPVQYVNPPSGSVVPENLPDSLSADIRASGFALLLYTWMTEPDMVEMDLSRARSIGSGDYAVRTNERQHFLKSTIGKDIRIVKIFPDTVVVSFEGKTEKRVAVRPNITINCAAGFRLGDSIEVAPEYVMVRGPEALISRITFIETEPKNYDDVTETVSDDIRLIIPDSNTQLSVQPSIVHVNAVVGKYTEGRFTLPLNVINVPSSVELKTFPDKVDVIFQIPIEDYSAIKPEMFRAVADYRKVQKGDQSMEVEIVRQPQTVRNVRTEPAKVDYIIRK